MNRTVSPAPGLHPATRIGLWLAFAVAVSWADWTRLGLLGLPLLAWSLWRRELRLARMLGRARWLLLPLLLIYGLATPGTPLLPWEAGPNLSLEGVEQGLLQASRIVLMITALAVVLGATPPALLVAGLLALLRPLRLLGAEPERMALRLSLTLHYAGEMAEEVRRDWRSTLASALQPRTAPALPVQVERPCATWRDGAALGVVAALCLLSLV